MWIWKRKKILETLVSFVASVNKYSKAVINQLDDSSCSNSHKFFTWKKTVFQIKNISHSLCKYLFSSIKLNQSYQCGNGKRIWCYWILGWTTMVEIVQVLNIILLGQPREWISNVFLKIIVSYWIQSNMSWHDR